MSRTGRDEMAGGSTRFYHEIATSLGTALPTRIVTIDSDRCVVHEAAWKPPLMYGRRGSFGNGLGLMPHNSAELLEGGSACRALIAPT